MGLAGSQVGAALTIAPGHTPEVNVLVVVVQNEGGGGGGGGGCSASKRVDQIPSMDSARS